MGQSARLVLSSCLLLVLPQCVRETGAPDLIEVRSLAPAQVGPGEQLELVGRGFPDGNIATVVFRGTLHRAGQPPTEDIRVIARSSSSRADFVGVPVTQTLHSEFCGTGPDAVHTTFRGRIVVAFSPKNRGAAPVRGSLNNVVLDWAAPTLDDQYARQQATSAERMAKALGLELESNLAEGRLVVKHASGRAAEAGLLAGDELLELDGLILRSPADLIPSSEGPYSDLVVRRPGPLAPFSRPLRVEGLTPVRAKGAAAALVLTIVACLLLAGCFAPASRGLTWVAEIIRARLHSVVADHSSATKGWGMLRQALHDGFVEVFSSKHSVLVRPLPFVLLASVAAAWTLLAFGGCLLAPGSDLVLLLGGPAALAVASAVYQGGLVRRSAWSLAQGLLAGVRAVVQQLPVVAAALCAISVIGSAHLSTVVTDQAGFPHHWTVFRGPGALIAFLLLCASLVPELGVGEEELPEAIGVERGPRRAGLGYVIEWLCIWVTCGLAAALFLGGWALPWPTSEPASTLPMLVVGAAVFQTKCWLLVLLVAASRWLLAHVRFEHVVGLWCRRVVPLSVAAVVMSAAWLRLVSHGPLRASEPWIVVTLFALTLSVLVLLAHRTLRACTSQTPTTGLNPWI